MKIGPLLAHLDELEAELGSRAASRGRASPRTSTTSTTSASPSPLAADKRVRRSSSRSRQRYDGTSDWPTVARGRQRRLLEDLRSLYLLAHEVAVTWTMAAQAAKALRDSDLLKVATRLPHRGRDAGELVPDPHQDRRPAGARGRMTETPARGAARDELAGRTRSSASPARRPARARVLRPRRRNLRRLRTPARLGRADRREAGRPLRPRVHGAAPVHRLDLRVPRPRRRRRDRHGPPQRHLGRHRPRPPDRAARLDEQRARPLPPHRGHRHVGARLRSARGASSSRRSCSQPPASASSSPASTSSRAPRPGRTSPAWSGSSSPRSPIYAAYAAEYEDVLKRPVLPLGRRGKGEQAIEGTYAQQVADVAHEPGVRQQL